MLIIDWLFKGDIIIQYLTNVYLLKKPFDHHNEGYISEYLKLYDQKNHVWGDGIYSPKWISSTYTLLELKYMEIQYDHRFYQQATRKVFNGLWFNKGKVYRNRKQDMCMSAMLLSLISYGRIQDDRISEIIDYILDHQMSDGGWNCRWDAIPNRSIVGSVHTTLSVLEAFSDYEKYGYKYRLDDIKKQVLKAQEYLLKRDLFKSLKTKKMIHKDMIGFHYPTRWKYDCFRALEYFVDVKHMYDSRMKDALDILKEQLSKGYIHKGKAYSGKVHFILEKGSKGRFNTYRALRILKYYDFKAYQNIIQIEYPY